MRTAWAWAIIQAAGGSSQAHLLPPTRPARYGQQQWQRQQQQHAALWRRVVHSNSTIPSCIHCHQRISHSPTLKPPLDHWSLNGQQMVSPPKGLITRANTMQGRLLVAGEWTAAHWAALWLAVANGSPPPAPSPAIGHACILSMPLGAARPPPQPPPADHSSPPRLIARAWPLAKSSGISSPIWLAEWRYRRQYTPISLQPDTWTWSMMICARFRSLIKHLPAMTRAVGRMGIDVQNIYFCLKFTIGVEFR